MCCDVQEGVPWNAIDRHGDCAGNYALKAGHQDIVDRLVQAGVTAELIFAALEKQREVSTKQRNVFQSDYLQVPRAYAAVCITYQHSNYFDVFQTRFDTDSNIHVTHFLHSSASYIHLQLLLALTLTRRYHPTPHPAPLTPHPSPTTGPCLREEWLTSSEIKFWMRKAMLS